VDESPYLISFVSLNYFVGLPFINIESVKDSIQAFTQLVNLLLKSNLLSYFI